MRSADPFTKLVSATLLALLLASLPTSTVHAQKRPPSRQLTVAVADRTDAGEFAGTWFFQTRSTKWAVWLRVEDGVPQMMLQYLNRDRGEGFKTDWQSVATYVFNQKVGEFRLEFTHRDENVMEGEWYWRLGTEGVSSTVRTETAKVRFYRAGMGRQLVLRFEDYRREYVSIEGEETVLEAIQAWTFHQSSRRLVEWEELPF